MLIIYRFSPISSNIIPEIAPIKYTIKTIFIFSFMFLFVLNNTASPTPAPVSKPDIMLAADITFSRYIFVKITDAAQFGIRPIRLATIGPKIF